MQNTKSGLDNKIPLVFVWSGGKLPSYAHHSISIARKNYSGEIIVLSPERPTRLTVRWEDSRKFSNPLFQRFEQQFQLDPYFRGGLWLKAYERFFILEKFASASGITRAFHAELDSLVVNLEGFAEFLDSSGNGLFVPVIEPHTVVASLVYWNDPEVLTDLCQFFVSGSQRENEMNALARFLNQPKSRVFSFATEQIWDTESWPYSPNSVDSKGGIVDAAGIGMWLFGQGPLTTRCSIWSKHKRQPSVTWPIEALSFRPGQAGKRLRLRVGGEEWKELRTIHVSSKIHGLLRFRSVLWLMIWLNHFPFAIPIRPRAYCVGESVAKALVRALSKRQNWFGKRLSSVLAQWLASFTHTQGYELAESLRQQLANISGRPTRGARSLPATVICADTNTSSRISRSVNTTKPTAPSTATLSIYAASDRIAHSPTSVDLGSLVSQGAQAFGFSGKELRALIEDQELWPIFLSRVINTEGLLFIRGDTSLDNLGPLFSKSHQVIFLSTKKDIYSLNQAKALGGVRGASLSWNYSSDCQAYRTSILRELFSSSDALLSWVKKYRLGLNATTLADYYGVEMARRGEKVWLTPLSSR